MPRSVIFSVFVISEAVVLLAAGLATIWFSQDFMLWLLWMIGEEWALGAQNVVRLEGGSTLLTNPGAMIRWMMPFWFLGAVQILSSITMIWAATSLRRRRQSSEPHPSSAPPTAK
jgi:hypothetical protein